MHVKKTIILILTCAIIFSCKKENNSSSANQADNCVTQQSKNVNIVEGQYIVVYKPASLDTRAMSTQRISQASQDVLQRNKISSSVIEQTFQGEPGGFVARLSAQEAAKLKNDADVEAVEPDRIIALSTCFTVAEPRLISWNLKRVGYGDGTGKTAWIIDTGIDFTHPDLTVDQTRSKSFINGVRSEEHTSELQSHS